MTTPIDPHPTKVKSKIFERYSWLPLVIAMLIGAFWVIREVPNPQIAIGYIRSRSRSTSRPRTSPLAAVSCVDW